MKVINRNFVTVIDKSTSNKVNEEIKNNVIYVQGKSPFTLQRNTFILEIQDFGLKKLICV